MSVLSAAFRSSNAKSNIVTPRDRVVLSFSSPPLEADDVIISVREDHELLDGTVTKAQLVGAFKGKIRNRQFIHDAIAGAPLSSEPDPIAIRIAIGAEPAAPHMFAHMPRPELLISQRLRLSVEGRVRGQQVLFEGKHPIHGEYPMAMIIPASGASKDPSLATVRRWAAQWQHHKRQFRSTVSVPIASPRDVLRPADYTPLVTAFKAAAEFSSSGVIALAVGHGDAGDTRSIPWCNLVPENISPENANDYRLDINDVQLLDGATPGTVPGSATRVKLDALDRISDVLTAGGARRVLLHTCRAGANSRFMQLLADRLRVPVFSHVRQIEYTLSVPVQASYAGDTPVLPTAERDWPIKHLGRLARPGAVPRRFGV